MKLLLATSLLAAGAAGLTLLAGTPAASADTPGGVANPDPPVVRLGTEQHPVRRIQEAMKPRHVVVNPGWAARVVAWTALISMTVLLALLLQSFAASALVARPSAEPPATCLSGAAAALADGDDVRERFLANLCGTVVVPHPDH